MRLSVALGCLLLAGCTGPHATGELWAQRLVEQETLSYRLSDAERASRLRAFELGLVGETLSAEQARIVAGLADCPGPNGDRQPLGVSVGDRARDTVRIGAHDDPARMSRLAQIALADWYVRRAHATGDSSFCDAARAALAGDVPALNGQSPTGGPTDAAALADLLSEHDTATVSRDPEHAGREVGTTLSIGTVSQALSTYALGDVDTVWARAPLPQYLAAVYGGVVLGTAPPPSLNGATSESLVDWFAPANPDWEPDALYAVFSSAK